MTYDFAFALVNCVGRLVLCGLLVWALRIFLHQFILIERLGVGLMGGTSFLTIAPILDVEKAGTPFDGWASLGFTIGCIMLFSGRIYRWRRHERANTLATEQARRYLLGKGKL